MGVSLSLITAQPTTPHQEQRLKSASLRHTSLPDIINDSYYQGGILP
ncbi:MAG: hypothetical protein AAGF83_11055 [Cyanobacteria bacterium P01_G01_bin.67]